MDVEAGPPASQTTSAPAAQVDAALLDGVAGGDEDALSALRHRHSPGLRRFLGAHLRDAQLAEEVLADVFVAVWRGASTYRSVATVKSWLYGIAWRRQRDARRAAGQLLAPTTDLFDSVDHAPGPADSLLGLPSAHGLVERVERLPPGLRAVLMLAFDQGMSYEEIGAALDLPVGTVRSRLHAARRRLRQAEPT